LFDVFLLSCDAWAYVCCHCLANNWYKRDKDSSSDRSSWISIWPDIVNEFKFVFTVEQSEEIISDFIINDIKWRNKLFKCGCNSNSMNWW